jgi:hypothetical protein
MDRTDPLHSLQIPAPFSNNSVISAPTSNNVSPSTGRLPGQQILDRCRNFHQLIIVKAKSIQKFRSSLENGNDKAIENVALTEVIFLCLLIF